MKLLKKIFSIIFYEEGIADTLNKNYSMTDTPFIVHICADFTVTGDGENHEWQKAQWIVLNKIDKEVKEYERKFKILYSSTGINVLFNGENEKITSDFENDFENIFQADVLEAFLS